MAIKESSAHIVPIPGGHLAGRAGEAFGELGFEIRLRSDRQVLWGAVVFTRGIRLFDIGADQGGNVLLDGAVAGLGSAHL